MRKDRSEQGTDDPHVLLDFDVLLVLAVEVGAVVAGVSSPVARVRVRVRIGVGLSGSS